MTKTIDESSEIQIEDFDSFVIDLFKLQDIMAYDKDELLKNIENPSQKSKIKHLLLECMTFVEELVNINFEHLRFFKTFLTDLNKMRLDSKFCESIFADNTKMVTSNELPALKTSYKELESKLMPLVESLFYSTLSIFTKNQGIDLAYDIKSTEPTQIILNLQHFLDESSKISKQVFENMEFFNNNYSAFIMLKKEFDEIKNEIVKASKS